MSSSQKWVKNTQICISFITGGKILKSRTAIALVPKIFSDVGISEFWNFDPCCDVSIPKLEVSGQNLHLRCVFQLPDIAEGNGNLTEELHSMISVFIEHR